MPLSRIQILEKYIPAAALDYGRKLLDDYAFHFRVTPPRKTKLGDYRYHPKTKQHTISVNSSLNPYAFLITFVHEVAHLKTFLEHRNKVSPHGKEWKRNFQLLMQPVLTPAILPYDLLAVLSRHMKAPKAGTYADPMLMQVLHLYDEKAETFLYQLPPGAVFYLKKEQFRKIELRRTRVLCENLANGKKYLVHKLAAVERCD